MRILLTTGLLCILNFCYGQEYTKLGDACYKNKDYTCAYDNYMKAYALKVDAKKEILYVRIGYCLAQMKKYEEARIWYWHSLSEKENLTAIWNLASACYQLKRYDSAAIYYTKAYSLATELEDKKSTSYWSSKSYFAQKNYTQARTQINESLKLDSAFENARLLLADIAYQLKDYPLAEKTYLTSLATEKDSSTISAINRNLGHIYYNAKKYPESLPFYRNALRFNEKNTTLMEYCGDTHYHLNITDSVKYYYKKALDGKLASVNGFDSSKIGSLSMSLISNALITKDTLQALQYLPVVVKYDPSNGNLERELNTLLTLRKDIRSMETIIPEYAPLLVSMQKKYTAGQWYQRMGTLYEEQKQTQKAMQSYRTAMAYDQTSYAPVNLFLNLLISNKKYQEALDSIDKKLLIGGYNKPRLLSVKGKIMYLQKDTANAAGSFREALKSDSYTFEPNYYLGTMALQRKDSVTAFSYWEKISNYLSPSADIPKEALVTVFRFNGVWYFKKAMSATIANSYYSTSADYFNRSLEIDSTLPAIKYYAGYANLQTAIKYDVPGGPRLTSLQISKRNEIYTKARYQLMQSLDIYKQKKDSLGMTYRWLGFIAAKGPGGTIKEAIPLYQKAHESNPKDSGIIDDLGIAYYMEKEYVKASETFGKNLSMLKNGANRAEAFYKRAISYYQNKQKELALADVGQCLTLSPEHVEGKKLKAELEKPGG